MKSHKLTIAVATLSLFVSVAALPANAAGSEVLVASDQDGASRGIGAFVISTNPDETRTVRILNPSGIFLAKVDFESRTDQSVRATYSDVDMALSVFFQAKLGRLDVRLSDGRTATWNFDVNSKQWTGGNGAGEVLSVVETPLTRIALANSVGRSSGSGGRFKPANAGEEQFQDFDWGILGGGGSCTPDTGYAVSGWGYDFRRSLAMELSTTDTNQRCSNSACWGCCSMLANDCACLYGNFYCYCSRIGYPCLY